MLSPYLPLAPALAAAGWALHHYKRLALNPADTDPSPMPVPPERVVEILAPWETEAVRQDKIEDYRQVGVSECWLVRTGTEVVDVLRLSPDGIETVAAYGGSDTVRSIIFPDLAVPVADIFEE